METTAENTINLVELGTKGTAVVKPVDLGNQSNIGRGYLRLTIRCSGVDPQRFAPVMQSFPPAS